MDLVSLNLIGLRRQHDTHQEWIEFLQAYADNYDVELEWLNPTVLPDCDDVINKLIMRLYYVMTEPFSAQQYTRRLIKEAWEQLEIAIGSPETYDTIYHELLQKDNRWI